MVPVAQAVTRTGSAPTVSTCVTVLGLFYVVEWIVPVAQAVTRTGSAPTVSTSVTVLGLLDVKKSMVPVAQVFTRTVSAATASTCVTVLVLLHVIKKMVPVVQTVIGLFCPDCQYQCHFAGSFPCDKVDRSCSTGCHQDCLGCNCKYLCHCARSALCVTFMVPVAQAVNRIGSALTASTCVTVLGLLYVERRWFLYLRLSAGLLRSRLPVPFSAFWVCSM
ncbi:hypothetical protein RRG08_046411 [Elysia crispata]|uniref:Uncharacterized protein n=1 Tax=Elysia crispata TaxID=231223 RepID=A0AAE1AFX5_9GAST|nr:hypothetical protein RRG08_046411 [Elysia crispata]